MCVYISDKSRTRSRSAWARAVEDSLRPGPGPLRTLLLLSELISYHSILDYIIL